MAAAQPAATLLYMTEPPFLRPLSKPPSNYLAQLVHLARPSPGFYRYIYQQILPDGPRQGMSDAELSGILNAPTTDIYILVYGGEPSGMAEIYGRQEDAVAELRVFGLTPAAMKAGLAAFMLDWVTDVAWAHAVNPARLEARLRGPDDPMADIFLRNGFVSHKTVKTDVYR